MSTHPTPANEIEATPLSYVWGDRIPCGLISVIAGPPVSGKSRLAARIAADVSGGQGLSNLTRPGRVLLSVREDDPGRMVLPRLQAQGAHLDNVFVTENLRVDHLDDIYDLIVVDPLAAHLDGSRYSPGAVRAFLEPLAKLAEQSGTAVLLIDHAKQGGRLTVDGPSASARAVYALDEGTLTSVKFNLGPRPEPLEV